VRELVEFTLRLTGKRRLLLNIPFTMADVLARVFEFLPNPPLTSSQVDLLKADNVVSGALPGFREFNIRPEAVEEVVPTYIGRSRTLQPKGNA
jgi:NADH dehydrogenase